MVGHKRRIATTAGWKERLEGRAGQGSFLRKHPHSAQTSAQVGRFSSSLSMCSVIRTTGDNRHLHPHDHRPGCRTQQSTLQGAARRSKALAAPLLLYLEIRHAIGHCFLPNPRSLAASPTKHNLADIFSWRASRRDRLACPYLRERPGAF